MFLRQHDLGDGAAVHGEGLEELWPRPHRLRVLHDHTHRSRTGPVGDLYPVTADTWGEEGGGGGGGGKGGGGREREGGGGREKRK